MMHKSARLLLLSGFLLAQFGTLLLPLRAAASDTPAPLAAPAVPAGAPAAGGPGKSESTAGEPALADQYGMSVEYGYAYDPQQDISFTMARVFAIYDYGTVWHTNRPKALRFKVEAAVGSTLSPSADLMASVNMLALYLPGKLTGQTLRPYFEAGIGAIYTEFRVPGQGLHFNFNPLLGAGCELPQADGRNPFVALRLHHLSNAGIVHDNRGVNSVVLQVGRYF